MLLALAFKGINSSEKERPHTQEKEKEKRREISCYSTAVFREENKSAPPLPLLKHQLKNVLRVHQYILSLCTQSDQMNKYHSSFFFFSFSFEFN